MELKGEELKKRLIEFHDSLIKLREETLESIERLKHSYQPKDDVKELIKKHNRYLQENEQLTIVVKEQLKREFYYKC